VKLLLVSLSMATFLAILLGSTNAEAKNYENDLYTLQFPNGCKIEEKENRFTSIDASIECKEDTGFQFESSEDLSSSLAGDSDEELLDTFLTAKENQWDNVAEVERGVDKYIINNKTAPFIITTYDQKFTNGFGLSSTKPWVSMTMIIRVGDQLVLAQYMNNEDDFDKQLPMAEKIFQSVKVVGNGAGAGTDDSFTSRGNDLPKTSALCDTVTTQSGKELCEELLN
jgi:hypothetical protein